MASAASFIGSFLGGFGGATVGSAVVNLLLDSRQFDTGLATSRAKLQSSTVAMGSSFSAFGGLARTGLLAAGAGIAGFAAFAVKEFSAAQQIAAQTAAVLESTGGAANVTASEVEGLAESLANLSGADDEAIQASSNLLLTFRAVRNEVGEGNDIFNQAQAAILDTTVALNQGLIPSQEALRSTTIQVGKALNDPIAGMTALRRVGVSFSQSQVETVKNLIETGQLLEAQKVILKELTKEFGGAAKAAGDTFAGEIGRLKKELGDLAETTGEVVVPVLSDSAGFLSDFGNEIGRMLGQIKEFAGDINPFAESIGETNTALVVFGDELEALARRADELSLQQLEAQLVSIADKANIAWQDARLLAEGISEIAINAEGKPTEVLVEDLAALAEETGVTEESLRRLLTGLGLMPAVLGDVAQGVRKISPAMKEFRDGVRETFTVADDVFSSLAEKSHVSASAIIRGFNRQIRALRNYDEDLQKIARRGLPTEMRDQLLEMGLEGAKIIDRLAEVNRRKFDEIVGKWKKAQGAGDDVTDTATEIGAAVDRLPENKDIRISILATYAEAGTIPPQISEAIRRQIAAALNSRR